MRLLHTSDWHLGKTLYGRSLLEDQANALEQLVEMAADFHPSALLVSGDIYDRVVPTPDSVALFDQLLATMVRDLKIRVIFIDGYSDSPERLAFASRLLEGQGVHAKTSLSGSVAVELRDESGPVRVYPLPCPDLHSLRTFLNKPDLSHPSEATRALVQKVRQTHPQGVRSVLVAHTPVVGGQSSPSEPRVATHCWLTPDLLEGFDLAALGYFHRPQSVASKKILFAGGLFPYSFDEAGEHRSANMVQMDSRGRIRVETAVFTPRRQLRRLHGPLEELLARPEEVGAEDLLEVSLTDPTPDPRAWGRLRELYKNLISLQHAGWKASEPLSPQATPAELFGEFYQHVTGSPLESDSYNLLEDCLARPEGPA